jgi:hypothetical protein
MSRGTQKIGRPAHHLIPHSQHARGTSSSTIPSILIHPILLHTPHIHSPALFFSHSPPRDNQLAAMRCHPGDDAPPRPSSSGRPGSSSLPSPGSGDRAPLHGVARALAPVPCVANTSASLGAQGRGSPATTSSRGGAARLPHGRHCRRGQDVSVGGGGAARCGGAVAPHDLPSPEACRRRVPEARGRPSIPPPLSSSSASLPPPAAHSFLMCRSSNDCQAAC